MKTSFQPKSYMNSANSSSLITPRRASAGSSVRNKNLFVELKSYLNDTERKLTNSNYFLENKVKISRDEAKKNLDEQFQKILRTDLFENNKVVRVKKLSFNSVKNKILNLKSNNMSNFNVKK